VAPPPRDAAATARRIERAHALQLERTRAARGSGAPAVEVAGGLAVSHGARSPFSAAIGVGLGVPVAEGDVDRIEAHLGLGGGPVRIEVIPFTDPSLTEELGRRGYQLERFFQVWSRAPSTEPPGVDVRIATPQEEGAWVDLFSRAFLGAAIQSDSQRDALRCMARAEGSVPWLAFENGAPVGVALSSAEGGVAWLSGAGVLPSSRGHGLQAAMVRARLAWAASQGCDLAASATEPGTASQRTLERCGFRVAYPKAVLVH
jgi:GNAT superfamily N-acetyltransferase